MTPELVITLGQEALKVTLMVGGPLILAGLVVGLIVSLFQATTQINEQALSFVPKILASLAALIFFGPWMLTTLVEFLKQMLNLLPQLAK